MTEYREYVAWDAPTRWFHWINVLAVLGLIGTGPRHSLRRRPWAIGIGKAHPQSVHASFGYVMAVNLVVAVCLGFLGEPLRAVAQHPSWRSGVFGSSERLYGSFLTGEPQQYVGHNPLARIAVALLFLLLLIQVATGLVIAGTDLYWPPFGRWFAAWVAAPGVDPSLVVPGAERTYRQTSYDAMRAFPQPVCRSA